MLIVTPAEEVRQLHEEADRKRKIKRNSLNSRNTIHLEKCISRLKAGSPLYEQSSMGNTKFVAG
ncbi:MAG: hypothetical protein K8F30_05345 [Taibaiella sp.]|nr:hypothetical protein [Taibaiella sp.]